MQHGDIRLNDAHRISILASSRFPENHFIDDQQETLFEESNVKFDLGQSQADFIE